MRFHSRAALATLRVSRASGAVCICRPAALCTYCTTKKIPLQYTFIIIRLTFKPEKGICKLMVSWNARHPVPGQELEFLCHAQLNMPRFSKRVHANLEIGVN